MKRLYLPVSMILVLLLFSACILKVEMEGDYVAPDNLKISMVAIVSGEKSPEIELIKIGETVYVKDPETQQWMLKTDVESYQEIEGLENYVFLATKFINAVEGLSLLNDEEINGILCYQVKGTIDPANLEDTSTELIPVEAGKLSAVFWIGKEDHLVRRMIIEAQPDDSSSGTETPMSNGSFSFVFEFSRYNEPIIIEAPQIDSD